MDTIGLLNNYRYRVLSDPYAVRWLTLLCRDGAMSEVDLVKLLGIPPSTVTRQATEMFRAHLLTRNEEDQWAASAWALGLLERLDLLPVVARELLHDIEVPREAAAFFDAIIETQSASNPKWTRKIIPILHYMREVSRNSDAPSRVFGAHCLFAVLLCIDSSAYEIGASGFVDYIYGWHSEKNTRLWSRHRTYLEAHKVVLMELLVNSFEHAKACNAELLEPRYTAHLSSDRGVTNCARLYATAINGDADIGLRAASIRWKNWRRLEPLFDVKSKVGAITSHLLATHGSWATGIDVSTPRTNSWLRLIVSAISEDERGDQLSSEGYQFSLLGAARSKHRCSQEREDNIIKLEDELLTKSFKEARQEVMSVFDRWYFPRLLARVDGDMARAASEAKMSVAEFRKKAPPFGEKTI